MPETAFRNRKSEVWASPNTHPSSDLRKPFPDSDFGHSSDRRHLTRPINPTIRKSEVWASLNTHPSSDLRKPFPDSDFGHSSDRRHLTRPINPTIRGSVRRLRHSRYAVTG